MQCTCIACNDCNDCNDRNESEMVRTPSVRKKVCPPRSVQGQSLGCCSPAQCNSDSRKGTRAMDAMDCIAGARTHTVFPPGEHRTGWTKLYQSNSPSPAIPSASGNPPFRRPCNLFFTIHRTAGKPMQTNCGVPGVPLFSPKGWNNKAQGNALGPTRNQRPKPCKGATTSSQACCRLRQCQTPRREGHDAPEAFPSPTGNRSGHRPGTRQRWSFLYKSPP